MRGLQTAISLAALASCTYAAPTNTNTSVIRISTSPHVSITSSTPAVPRTTTSACATISNLYIKWYKDLNGTSKVLGFVISKY